MADNNNLAGSDLVGEFDRTPVTPERLLSARHFAASYAGEHVAGTEFVIGATFVAWGVSTSAVIGGLILGNLLAVLSWALLCAPVATDTRLTLYAYLERIAGPSVIRLYSVLNGIFFCVLGGAMITVSASAVRILFGIEPQVHWYPTSAAFAAVALGVGAIVVLIAVRGFAIVARFAEVCAPWMILMFASGALALWPVLSSRAELSPGAGLVETLWTVGDAYIWVEKAASSMTIWHVAAFAWICNVPMHVGMSDMTILRFARHARYGWLSALGMYIGHFGAWICAGIMGAGAATLLMTGIQNLDAGEVAYQALGSAGIITVIVAGWTTSNPTIYRAGLAFQSLNRHWSRRGVTVVTGTIIAVIACFPFVFSRLMDFLSLMGLLLAPVGAIIIAEHWIFPRLGLTRYWSSYKGQCTNRAALLAWGCSLLVALVLHRAGLHLFFLLLPAWLTALLVYVPMAAVMGARDTYPQACADECARAERKSGEASAFVTIDQARNAMRLPLGARICRVVAWIALATCGAMAVAVFLGADLQWLRTWLILPTVVYFLCATQWVNARERCDHILNNQ